MGRDDRLHDLILGIGDESEECGITDRRAVFAEDEGGGGARDTRLIGVYRVFGEARRPRRCVRPGLMGGSLVGKQDRGSGLTLLMVL